MNNEKLERNIAALRAGDLSAFGAVYDATNRTVYFRILYIVKSRQDAEDLLQNTYVRALKSIGSYEPGTNFLAWLSRIGKNLALNFLEKRKREVATDFDADAWKYGAAETDVPWIFDLAAKILSPEEYEIVMLLQVAGYKRREVAAMLEIPAGTVAWKNSEALKKLRKELEKEDRT